jgi:hypothetical protein
VVGQSWAKKNEILSELKNQKRNGKTKSVSGVVMLALPDADVSDMLCGAPKSMKDGSQSFAVPLVNG